MNDKTKDPVEVAVKIIFDEVEQHIKGNYGRMQVRYEPTTWLNFIRDTIRHHCGDVGKMREGLQKIQQLAEADGHWAYAEIARQAVGNE